jgi:hypothetical protein
MQVGPPEGTELLVDRGADQGVRERDLPDAGLLADVEQPSGDGLLQVRERFPRSGQRRGRGQRDAPAEDRRRLDQPARRERARIQPADDARREGVGCRQHGLPVAPPVRRQLGQQRLGVERVPSGVGVQPLRDAGRQLGEPQCCGQAPDVGRFQRPEPYGDARGAGGHPAQAVRQPRRLVRPDDQDREHPLGHQPAVREEQRPQRVDVGPVRVVDDHGDGALDLELTEHVEHPLADRRHARRPPRAGGQQTGPPEPGDPDHLVDDAVGDEGLPLLTARPQDLHVVLAGQELLDERGLTDPLLPLHQHQGGPAGAGGGERRAQDVQLRGPPDERAPRRADRRRPGHRGHGPLLRAGHVGGGDGIPHAVGHERFVQLHHRVLPVVDRVHVTPPARRAPLSSVERGGVNGPTEVVLGPEQEGDLRLTPMGATMQPAAMAHQGSFDQWNAQCR